MQEIAVAEFLENQGYIGIYRIEREREGRYWCEEVGIKEATRDEM